MDQPELGKKIVELRKAKGFTQEELVEKCKLSVRTIQRIEAGEVVPRSYTVRIIFAALDYQSNEPKTESRPGFGVPMWLEQAYLYVLDLFNLRTNTMKKISILSVVAIAATFLFISVFTDGNAQGREKLEATIAVHNKNFVRWFNNGQIDSLVSIYHDDACLVSLGCGKPVIVSYFTSQFGHYKMKEIQTTDLSVSDALAVEKGQVVMIAMGGEEFLAEFLTEWKRVDGVWRIQKDMASIKH